jgi:hypothetical protein
MLFYTDSKHILLVWPFGRSDHGRLVPGHGREQLPWRRHRMPDGHSRQRGACDP